MKKQALGKRRHEAKHGDCIFTRESVDVCPVHRKYAAIRAVAPYTVNMQRFAPSMERPLATATSNLKTAVRKKLLKLVSFFGARFSSYRRVHGTL